MEKHTDVVVNGHSVWSCETAYSLKEWHDILKNSGETVFSLTALTLTPELQYGTAAE